MILEIRKSRVVKPFAIFFALQLTISSILPQQLFALTNGPSQPEMSGPSAVTFDNYVDPFTGDFQYSIPLFEMGDIPLTLNYNAGSSTEQEASWVGLGWSLNPGSINRDVRGLPDDFKGDNVINDLNIKDNITAGIDIGTAVDLFGIPLPGGGIGGVDELTPSLGLNVSFQYNNYTGYTLGTTLSPSIALGDYASIGFNLSGSSGSFGELGITPSIGLSDIFKGKKFPFGSLSANISSREGLAAFTLTSTDKHEQSAYFATSGSLTFKHGQKTYTPTLSHSFNSFSFTRSASVGVVPIFGTSIPFNTNGFYTSQKLEETDKHVITPAYGYFYADNEIEGNILTDFNREKEDNIDEKSPNLPIPFYTYDTYSISSPNVSGAFRAFRNDVGYIVEKTATNTSNAGSIDVGIEGGNGYSPELTAKITRVNSVSKNWDDFNLADEMLPMASKQERNNIGEGVYFAMTNEMIPEGSLDFVQNNIQDNKPTEFQLWGEDLSVILSNSLVDKESNVTPMLAPFARIDTRQLRVTNISYMTKADIEFIEDNQFITDKAHPHKLNTASKEHHITEFTHTTSDGTKSVFGLAAYNTKQKEVTFAIGHASLAEAVPVIDGSTNYVKYSNADGDNTTTNKNGLDNYFSSTETPAFVHSYMLTAILSPDYVDATGDGPSDDDMGSYIKYNYGIPDDDDEDGTPDIDDLEGDIDGDKYYFPDITNFKWRTPSTSDDKRFYAQNQEGIRNNYSDDKANYIYGEKEIWYLHSIETKDYVVEFVLVPRYDGLGAQDENGGVDEDQKLSRIDKINLYAKSDLIRYKYSSEFGGEAIINFDEEDLATPLKTIHFVYTYELCEGIPNKITDPEISGTGKLTLKGLYFTYQDSKKGQYRPYTFTYGYNPDYGTLSYDRWGNYRPLFTGAFNNVDYPYVFQNDPESVDLYASAWCLSKIETPSGGEMEIFYESDRYGYIQNREATYMYEMLGASPTFEGEMGDMLYHYDETSEEWQNHLYLFFKLPHKLDATFTEEEANKYIQDNCIKGYQLDKKDPTGIGQNIYFRFYTTTKNLEGIEATEFLPSYYPEYITGYGTIDFNDEHWAGVKKDGAGDYTIGYIKLAETYAKFSDLDTEPINPIAKAGWQFAMLNTRYIIMEQPYIRESYTFDEFLGEIGSSLIESVFAFNREPNKIMRNDQHIAQFFKPELSSIRLGALDREKLGGGHRVKKITMNDKWEDMTANVEEGFTYGKEYEYLTDDGLSSGVASYEPFVGNDENPLRYPIDYHHQDYEYEYEKFIETPLGESFYPSPVVGYSKVTVRDIVPLFDDNDNSDNSDDPQIKRQGTGKIVYRFYTAKDYPVKYSCTNLVPQIKDPSGFSLSGVVTGTRSISLYTASQGYVIETNDMHGKQFTEEIYPETSDQVLNPSPLSKTTYYYNENLDGTLNNTVNVCNPKGEITQNQLGVTYDVTADFREQYTITEGNTANFDLDVAPSPIFVPILLLPEEYGFSSTRTAVMTKVINRNGIIIKVVTQTDGSLISAENVLFDSKTGSPILTTTQNEFDDNYFVFNMPAHWVYKNMELASENYRYSFEGTPAAFLIDEITGQLNMESENLRPLISGDKINLTLTYADAAKNSIVVTVYKSFGCDGPDSECYYFIDESGELITYDDITHGDAVLIAGHVLWPGRKNQPSAPVMEVLTRLIPILDLGPMIDNDELQIDLEKIIIDASATEYSDRWQNTYKSGTEGNYCTSIPDPSGDNDVINPYNEALLGIWRPLVAYKYLTDRDYTYTKDTETAGFGGAYTDIRNDGAYSTFTPFWIYDDGEQKWVKIADVIGAETEASKWQYTAKTTKISPYIGEVESKDALGIYSATILNHNNSLAAFSAQNANYNQIGFEDFEDFYFLQALGKDCDDKHFDLTSDGNEMVAYKYAHTGKYSAELDGSRYLRFSTSLVDFAYPREENDYTLVPFEITNQDLIPTFNPLTFSPTGKEYVMDFWVKRPTSSSVTEPISVDVKYDETSVSPSTSYSASDIDGWYRYETRFIMPISSSGHTFEIIISNASTYTTAGVGMGEVCATCTYIDDVRIMPYDAVGKSYVYDARSKRLMSVLDENHYATFYEYDEDGKLIRVKKETERGIVTIQEGRYFTVKE